MFFSNSKLKKKKQKQKQNNNKKKVNKSNTTILKQVCRLTGMKSISLRWDIFLTLSRDEKYVYQMRGPT